MQLQVLLNGKATILNETCVTLADLLAEPPWSERKLLAEVNGAVIKQDAYGETRLSEGDRIELVHFVGGG